MPFRNQRVAQRGGAGLQAAGITGAAGAEEASAAAQHHGDLSGPGFPAVPRRLPVRRGAQDPLRLQAGGAFGR